MKGFFALCSAVWKYAGSSRPVILLYSLLFIAANTIWLFEPYVVGRILNAVQQSGTNPDAFSSIANSLFLFAGLSLGFWIFHGPARVLERETAFRIRIAFKQHLFQIVTSLPLQWHKNHHSGQTINRMSKATGALFDFTENSYQIIEMCIRPLGALVALFIVFPTAAFTAILAMSVACILVFLFDRVLLPLYDKINEKDHFVASALHDYVTNVTTVITLRLEALAQSELLARMQQYFPVFRREVHLNEVKWFLATMAIALTTAGVLLGYAYGSIQAGAVPLVGTFFMLYEYLQRIGGAFYTFAWKYSQIVEQYAKLKSVHPILDADLAVSHDACFIDPAWKKIEIQNLHFSYKDQEHDFKSLDNVSFTLLRGRRIAFIGESGSGKSTLMSLLRGLHEADSGTVVADGNILPHGLRDVGSTVTLIPQEPEIFENTIEYNITLDTEQSTDEIMEDVTLARFDRVLTRLPKGLKTHTAEKGVNLSGGEKQRLALARGFFAAKRSSLLLLDEPTSSVDPANERAIYENLFQRFSDRCVISSLHKLYLLPLFHEAYVFQDGKIIAHGTPDALLGEGGVLHPLWVREQQATDLTTATAA